MKLYNLLALSLLVLTIAVLYFIISVTGKIHESANWQGGYDDHGYPIAIRK